MSQKEFQRVMENAVRGRLSVREPARLLHLALTQLQRLKRRYQPDAIDWYSMAIAGVSCPGLFLFPQKQLILRLARGKYQGFNDSHWTEKLAAPNQ